MDNKVKKFEKKEGHVPTFFGRYFDDDFFKRFLDGGEMPAVNVKENKKEYKVELSAPGFEKEDFNIQIDKNVLTISATDQESKEERDEDERLLRQEFKSSSFSRSFTLPEDIDTENITAKQKHGILKITLPKRENVNEDTTKKIAVE